jgi:hypothetical protein
MAIYKHTSCKTIIRKVMRDLKPNDDNWVDDAIEWIGEALEHIGASAQFCKKKTVLHIKDNKALLPSDLYYIDQVATNGMVQPAIAAELLTLTGKVKDLKDSITEYNKTLETDLLDNSSNVTNADLTTYDTQYKTNVLELNEINSRIIVLEGLFFNNKMSGTNTSLTPLSYGSSTFPESIHCVDCVNEISNAKDSYIIDCDYLKTSFPSGQVCLTYTAFPLDDDCFPLVPDDISFREALFWYIFKKLLLGGWDKPTNKIDYAMAEQMWAKYCSQARANATFPDIDRMESFKNQWVRLVPDVNAHSVFFEELGTRENLNRSY